MRYLIMLFLIVGCTTEPKTQTPQPEPTATPPMVSVVTTPPPPPQATPNPQPRTTIRVKVSGGTERQRERLTKIALNIEQVINSKEFRSRLLGSYYKGKPGFFGSNYSPSYVLKEMLEADELNRGKRDYVWDLQINIKQLKSGVYGQMWPNKIPIEMNSLYLNNRLDHGLGGTICHEFNHLVGFNHTANYTPERAYTPPYVLGTVCAQVYQAMKFK